MGRPWSHIHRARKYFKRAGRCRGPEDQAKHDWLMGMTLHYDELSATAEARNLKRPAPRASAHDAALIARAAYGTEVVGS